MGRAVDVRVVVSSCSVTAVEVASGDTTLLLLMLPAVVSIENGLEEGNGVISELEEMRGGWVLTVNSEESRLEEGSWVISELEEMRGSWVLTVNSEESRLEEGSRVISGLEETRDSCMLTVNSEVVTMPVCVGDGTTVSVTVETVLVVTDTT